MRLTPLVLAATATTAVLASHIEPNSNHQQLERREPTFGLLEGVLGGLFGHGHSQTPRYPSQNWKCNGRGNDGFSLDIYGQVRPSWVPAKGWAYFGWNLGWMPTASFECDAKFKIPSQFLPRAHLCSWWTPSTAWKNHNIGIDIGISVPNHWHWSTLPAANWQCDGGGRDGLEIDFKGNTRPSWAPSGWLWWGTSIGWGPSASFECDADFEIPSQLIPSLHLIHWWTPSVAWKHKHTGISLGFNIPGFWNWSPLPAADWKCDGKGKDGWTIDHKGNGPPSWVPSSGWYWYGVEIGWQPSASWSCGSSWSIPTQWQSSCGKATWWTPPKPWVSQHHGHNWGWSWTPPSHWGCEVPATITRTSSVPVITTSVKPATTSSQPANSSKPATSSKATTSVKATTTSKPKTSHSATTTSKPKSTTSSKPKPTGGNATVTVTITKTVTVPAPTGGGSGSCPCKPEPYRLARRDKSRLD